MIVCPVCRALLVGVAPDATRQFICGCPHTTWAYRANGDLDRLDWGGHDVPAARVGVLQGGCTDSRTGTAV